MSRTVWEGRTYQLITSVEALYGSGVAVPDVTDMSIPNIHVYRLSLIFIITAGRLDDRELNMFSPNSAALHALAIKHLPAAFHVDDLVGRCDWRRTTR